MEDHQSVSRTVFVFSVCRVCLLDVRILDVTPAVNPGTRAPGHRRPGTWSQGIFLFYFLIFLAGVNFFQKNFFSLFFLFLSLFLSFSVHTLWVLLSLMNFTQVRCEGNSKKVINVLIDDNLYVPR
jgi:hypothetical protein